MPDLALPDRAGQRVDLSRRRGQANLVMVFLGIDSRRAELAALLAELRAQAAEFLAENTRLALVIPGGAALPDEAGQEFMVLVDEDGAAHRRVGAADAAGQPAAAAFVTDRFGEIYDSSLPGEGGFTAAAMLDWLRYVEIQCPE